MKSLPLDCCCQLSYDLKMHTKKRRKNIQNAARFVDIFCDSLLKIYKLAQSYRFYFTINSEFWNNKRAKQQAIFLEPMTNQWNARQGRTNQMLFSLRIH